jgi:signal transduction histidine kinase/ligand-binding sensor domain-containing protein
LLVFVSASMFGIDRDRRLDQLYHTKWTYADGAPAEIFALAQTADGYLWMGTTTGLVRFDGLHFQRYESIFTSALEGRNVCSLLAMPDGGLWIGFASGGVSYLKDGQVKNYREKDGAPSNSVRALAVDRQGVIWAAALGGLARFDGAKWSRVGSDRKIAGIPTTDLVDRQGTLWVASGSNLYSLREGAKQFQLAAKAVGYITRLTQAPDGTVWMSALGMWVQPIPLPVKGAQTQPRLIVSSLAILADDQGSLWAPTLVDGLYRLADPERLAGWTDKAVDASAERFTQKDGLSSDHIESILEDREGNIWIGTSAGLDRFRQSSVVPVAFPPAYLYISLLNGDQGSVWVVSQDHPTNRITNGRLIGAGALASKVPTSICTYRDANGTVWANTMGYLTRIDGAKLTEIPYPDYLGPNQDLVGTGVAMTEDRAGSLWVSLKDKGVYRLENGHWTSLASMGGPSGFALSAFTDSIGRVWFGYLDKSVVMVDGGNIRVFTDKDGATVGKVRSIHGRDSRVWIAGDDGVAFFDGRGFRTLTPADGASFHDVFGVLETADHSLWFSETRGIVHVPPNEVGAFEADAGHRVSYRLFDRLDGLPEQLQKSAANPSLIEDNDKRLWFATTQGVVWVDPKRISYNPVIPPISIESVMADGKSLGALSSLQLPPRTLSLRIAYTALSLTIPERVRFKYKLDGVDSDWQEASTRREAAYTNLGPGSYHFHVIACNNDGVWNERGSTLSFVILPAFYQTYWFRAMEWMAAAGLLWLLYWLRLRQVTLQIHERLDTQLEERERIARELHDTFLQGFQGLILRFQAVMKLLPKDGAAFQMMVEAMDRADHVLLEGRQSVRDLREATISGRSLSESLMKCGEELAPQHSSQFSVAVLGTPLALSPVVYSEVERIAREAIMNAFQHSRAVTIEVELTYGRARLCIRVRDNGIGIDEETLHQGKIGHWGLSGMRERAQKIGAQLNIWSTAKAGTEIELLVPGKVAYAPDRSHSLLRRFQSAIGKRQKEQTHDE